MSAPLALYLFQPDHCDEPDLASPARMWLAPREEAARGISAADTDSALVERLRAGDMEAFETVYRAHASGLAAFTNSFVHAPDIAEELVGDMFVRLWETRATFAPVAGIRAYLYSAVRHRALNYVRGERREIQRYRAIAAERQDVAATTGDMIGTGAEDMLAVQRVIDTFPSLRRQVMELRWRAGLSNPEIAATLGITDQAVRSHLSRAVRDLREAFPELIR